MKKLLLDLLKQTVVAVAVGALTKKSNASQLVIDLEEMRKDKSEGSLYYAWQANIAMAFYDECIKQGSTMQQDRLGKLCNDGAKRFLDQLISPSK